MRETEANMVGLRGKSGPPGNQNAFTHGLAAAHNRRADGSLTEAAATKTNNVCVAQALPQANQSRLGP